MVRRSSCPIGFRPILSGAFVVSFREPAQLMGKVSQEHMVSEYIGPLLDDFCWNPGSVWLARVTLCMKTLELKEVASPNSLLSEPGACIGGSFFGKHTWFQNYLLAQEASEWLWVRNGFQVSKFVVFSRLLGKELSILEVDLFLHGLKPQ